VWIAGGPVMLPGFVACAIWWLAILYPIMEDRLAVATIHGRKVGRPRVAELPGML
jgi:hypothetical protein